MNYLSWNIRDTMGKISKNEIYLPAIQRKFVWGPDRIEKLFDSIMRGYPIGTFLFWIVKGDEVVEDNEKDERRNNGGAKDQYTFYKFIQNYHERDCPWNEVAPNPDLRDHFIGVLDGQQRLNSMYVALQGSYAYRRKHGRWNDDAAFPERQFYINLLYQPDDEDESGVAYQFAFLTKEQARFVDDKHYWFQVKAALAWKGLSSIFECVKQAVERHPQHSEALRNRCGPLLSDLWQRLCKDDVINYFSVHDQELDKVVDIFVRVNSAGVQLSKTDLLFSSIVAHWDEGRSSIEATIQAFNAKGNRFAFDSDFVMRCCLVLTDLPIRFKVNSFKKENIEQIKANWPAIKDALETMVDLLVEWGFCGETLPTFNAVIPIAYFAFKNGNVEDSKRDLQQYLIRALVNQIFANKTDRVLAVIRDRLRVSQEDGKAFRLKSVRFVLREFLEPELSRDWTLKVGDEDIEEFLEETIGPYTFMLLSLLYPYLQFNQIQVHQDHIHPKSRFTPKMLKEWELSDEKIKWWLVAKDKLPNLQLMEGVQNKTKNATPFDTWIETLGSGKDHFMKSNLISENISLKLRDFEEFYEDRKELLRQKLSAVFIP